MPEDVCAILGLVRYQTLPKRALRRRLHKSPELLHLRRVQALLASSRLLPSDLRAEPMLADSRVLKVVVPDRASEARRSGWRVWPAWVVLSSPFLLATPFGIVSTAQHSSVNIKPVIARPALPVVEKALNPASQIVAAGPGPRAVVLGGIASELVKGKVRTYVKQGRTWILEAGG